MSFEEIELLFGAVATGTNVVTSARMFGYPLDEVLEVIWEREGDYRAALRRVPRVTFVTSHNPANW